MGLYTLFRRLFSLAPRSGANLRGWPFVIGYGNAWGNEKSDCGKWVVFKDLMKDGCFYSGMQVLRAFVLDNSALCQLNWLEKAKWIAFCQKELANLSRKG